MAIPRRNAPGVSLTRCCKCHGPGQVRRQEESASGLSRGFKKCKKPNTFRETLEIGRFLEKLGKFKNRLEILGKYGIISLLRRCSSSVEHQLPKLGRRVRFPSSAYTEGLVNTGPFLFLKIIKTAGDFYTGEFFSLKTCQNNTNMF